MVKMNGCCQRIQRNKILHTHCMIRRRSYGCYPREYQMLRMKMKHAQSNARASCRPHLNSYVAVQQFLQMWNHCAHKLL